MSSSEGDTKLKPGQLIRALYAYEANAAADKVLTFEPGDQFILIKSTKPEEWLYVINAAGLLGYIPANFVTPDNVSDIELLAFLDRTIHFLELMEAHDMVSTRQKNHAQVKLTQLRCDLNHKIQNLSHSSKISNEADSKSNVTVDDEPSLKEDEAECKSNGTAEDGCHSNGCESSIVVSASEVLATTVALDLLEKLRSSMGISHDMCKTAILLVMETLAESIGDWSVQCHKIRDALKNLELMERNNSPIGASMDATKLTNIFKSLWSCKNDVQQRSWPVHEDEHMIRASLEELLKILVNANPSTSREFISKNSYENVHMLVNYYQMESRRNLRMAVLSIVSQMIFLDANGIIDQLLNSVLPSILADEMINYPSDVERWSQASILFTIIFSTGQKPPITMYQHVNDKFILKLLDIVEEVDITGKKVDTAIVIESSLPPILSFGLHFKDHEDSLVIRALAQRPNASHLTENLVSHLNWEEDPTVISASGLQIERINSVHKLLHEIFSEKQTAKLFYYNDVRVVIDIIITHLNNLQAGDKTRIGYLKIAESIIKNTAYVEEPHKLKELTKCLDGIKNHDCSSDAEKELTSVITKMLPSPRDA